MRKIVLSLTMAIMVSVILTGCFGKSNSNQSVISANKDDFSSSQPVLQKGSDPDVFTIRVLSHFTAFGMDAINFKRAVEEQYKIKYPKATIQWDEQTVDWVSTHADSMNNQFIEKKGPDVLFYFDDISKFVKDGYLLDLSDQPWVADLRSNIADDLSYNGKVYGGSMGMFTFGVWYNKEMFSKLDLQVPHTWSEYIALCTKIKAVGIAPLAAGLYPDGASSNYFGYFAQSAEYLSSPDFELNLHKGIGKIIGPEYQGALKKFQELAQDHFFYDTPLKDSMVATTDFLTGKAAMLMNYSLLPYYKDSMNSVKSTIDLGFFPLPDENGNMILQANLMYKMYINSNSKLIRQSQDLVSIFMSKELASLFAKETGILPVVKGVIVNYRQHELNEVLQWINSNASNFNLVQWGKYLPESVRLSIGDELVNIASDKPSTGRELEDAQKKFDKDKDTVVLPE